MSVSVLIPTMVGREQVLFETTAAYLATAPGCEILTTEGKSWGAGLNELAEIASNDWLLFAPDDAAPLGGWLESAMGKWAAGVFPCARYLNRDGSPCVEQDGHPDGTPCTWTRLFLLERSLYERLGPMIDTTWWADIEYSERIVDSGFPCQIAHGFAFTHLDGDRSWLTAEEEARQRDLYDLVRARKLGAVRVP